jgi:hypothetical protein
LNRIGVEVVVPEGEGCCGALVHHMGREHDALDAARRNVDAWTRQIDAGGLDAIIITASGCGTTIKDYGYMLREDPAYAEKAAHVSAIAKDITEYLASIEMPAPVNGADLVVAYHSACSMQHGQKITTQPKDVAQGGWLYRQGSARGPSLLRFGRHLQHHAARDRPDASRPQGQEHRADKAGPDRHRQYRLHDPDRRRHRHPDHSHG